MCEVCVPVCVLQYIKVLCILGLHVVFVVLTLVRATSGAQWSWFIPFIPLFVFDVISVVYWIGYLIAYIYNKWTGLDLDEEDSKLLQFFPKQTISLLVLLAYALGIPLKVVAEILLALHLSDPGSIRTFVPALLFMLLFLEIGIVAVIQMLKPIVRLHRD